MWCFPNHFMQTISLTLFIIIDIYFTDEVPEAGEIPTANKRWGQVSNPGNLTPVPRCLPPGYRAAPPSTPSLLHPGSSSGVRENGTSSRTAPLHHCSSLFRGFLWSPPGSPHPTYLLLCSQCDFCPAITHLPVHFPPYTLPPKLIFFPLFFERKKLTEINNKDVCVQCWPEHPSSFGPPCS